MLALKIVATILISYLIGTLNLAYFISKAKGVDMKGSGTGNYGTSNSFVLMGAKIGVLVAVHDIGKTVISVVAATLIFPEISYIGFVAGAASVLGHIFPFYLKFSGGKGFASYLGMCLALEWKYGLILVAVVVVAILVTNYMVAGTMLTVLSLPVYALLAMNQTVGAIVVFAVTLVIIVKHIENFKKILNKTEFRVRDVIFKKKKSDL